MLVHEHSRAVHERSYAHRRRQGRGRVGVTTGVESDVDYNYEQTYHHYVVLYRAGVGATQILLLIFGATQRAGANYFLQES